MPVPSAISNLSTTAASNSPAGSETPSSADDYLRAHAAFIKQAYDAAVSDSAAWSGTAGGTANALTLTPSPAITAYAAGQVFRFKAGASSNTAATTVAISGLAAIELQSNGAACVGGEILANKWYEILLTSATNAQLLVADKANYVATSGVQTIADIKTFTSSPVVPDLPDGDNTTKSANSKFVQRAIYLAAPTPVQIRFTSRTTSGNFTTPSNITTSTIFKITLIGAGAGGGGSDGANASAQGGGAGGGAVFYVSGLSPSTAYSVTIGARGVGGISSGVDGTDGGSTSITINGVVYAVGGGVKGVGSTASAIAATAPQGAISGQITLLANWIGISQVAFIGFAASPTFVGCNGGAIPPYGTNGIAGRTSSVPAPGSGYGWGGGGGVGATMTGGDGGNGLFIAEWTA